MKILIDAMGGDNSPDEIIKGCVQTVDELESEIILIGDESKINEKVKDFYGKDSIAEVNPKLTVKNASEVISNHESPTEAIRSKKDSSMQMMLPLNFEEKKSIVEEELKKIDVLNITPIEAISILSSLKEKIK